MMEDHCPDGDVMALFKSSAALRQRLLDAAAAVSGKA
jgi:hypothetical protein